MLRLLRRRSALESLPWYRAITVLKYIVLTCGILLGAFLFFIGFSEGVYLIVAGVICVLATAFGWVGFENAVIYIFLGGNQLQRDDANLGGGSTANNKFWESLSLDKIAGYISFAVSFAIAKAVVKSASEFGAIVGFCVAALILQVILLKVMEKLTSNWSKVSFFAPVAAYLVYAAVWSLGDNSSVPFALAGTLCWSAISFVHLTFKLPRESNPLTQAILGVLGIIVGFLFVAPSFAFNSALGGVVDICASKMEEWASNTSFSDRHRLCKCTFSTKDLDAKSCRSPSSLTGAFGVAECIGRKAEAAYGRENTTALLQARDQCLQSEQLSGKAHLFYASYREQMESLLETQLLKEIEKDGQITDAHKHLAKCFSKNILDDCQDKSFVGYTRCSNTEDDATLTKVMLKCRAESNL